MRVMSVFGFGVVMMCGIAGLAAAPGVSRAAAASPCQGLSASACGAKTGVCSWIKASTMKNGKTRKAHCRKKPKAASKAS